MEKIKIPFYFRINNNFNSIQKEDGSGRKRRYLEGISSGPREDRDGERMTANCVKGMQEQALRGDILLYAGRHGQDQTDDIGILVESDITKSGEWKTLYRLYDEYDGFAPNSETIMKADKLWKQINGIEPYNAPIQVGLSIEGSVPEGGILSIAQGGGRTIDKCELEGVYVVRKPSYDGGWLQAIQKALDGGMEEITINVFDPPGFKSKIREKVIEREETNNYYNNRYLIDDVFDEQIRYIINQEEESQVDLRLKMLVDEYAEAMYELITNHKDYFREKVDLLDGDMMKDVYAEDRFRVVKESLKNINDRLDNLLSIKKGAE